MAEADWTVLNDSLGVGSVKHGTTAGFTPPPGASTAFVYAFNSVDLTPGAVGRFTNLANFAPTPKGGSIKACLQRAPSAGPAGFAPMLFFSLQGPSVNDRAYLLGLSDNDPSRIILRKGVLFTGLPDVQPDPAVNGVLRRGTLSVARATWVHLRLDVVTNANGDVRLQVFQNDLVAHPLSGAPVWTAVPGVEEFVDDAMGINSGSSPLPMGRTGWAFRTEDVNRRAFVYHVQASRQT